MNNRITRIAAVIAVVTQVSNAETISFDFNSGVDFSNFSVFTVGELFAIDTDGPDLRISKPEDDGTVLPLDFLLGGIKSRFTIDGDFTVTIDFTLRDFPPTQGPCCPLNESLLAVVSEDGSMFFEILRLRIVDYDGIESFATPGGVMGAQPSTLASGRYRITRSGTVLTAWFSDPGGAFTSLGSVPGFDGPFRVQPFAAQGKSVSGLSRSTTALDVSFDNLVIEADQIHFPCHADINGSGDVNVIDLVRLLLCFGEPAVPVCVVEDINFDGTVNVLDLIALLLAFGPCP